MIRKSDPLSAGFFLYLFLFHAIWIGYIIWFFPWMQMLGDKTFLYALTSITFRLTVWVLSVFMFLRYFDHIDPIEYLKLKQNWKKGIIFAFVPFH